MSRFAIILALSVSLLTADVVRADDTASPQEFRNPITWLLDDLGKLLPDQVTPEKDTTSADKSDPANPFKSLFASLAKLFEPSDKISIATSASTPASAETEVVQEVVTAEETIGKTKSIETVSVGEIKPADRNPVEWLLSDLAKIFQPDLTIDQGTSKAATTVEAEVPAAPVQKTADAVTETPKPEVSEEPLRASDQRNPIRWLLSDIAGLFETMSAPKAQVVAETNDVVPNAEPISVERSNADVAEKIDVSIKIAPKPDTITSTKNALEVKIRETAASNVNEAELLPGQSKLHTDIFDPRAPLFDTQREKLPPLAQRPLVVASTEPSASAASPAPSPALRTRPAYKPEQKNHRKLGEDHKAVTEKQDTSLIASFMENLVGIDDPGIPDENVSNKIADRIVPEEKLQLGYTSPDAPDVPAANELTKINGGPLGDQDLYLGKNAAIGVPYKQFSFDPGTCVERNVQVSVFCLNDMQWPGEIAKSFNADTAFLMPGEGVIRFENGLTSRVYSVFKASDFHDVVKFMQRRFGPPQEREVGWMHMLEAPRLPNTTFRWLALSADRADTIVLEVRNFDDLRRSFADMDHGMVRLYRQGSRPIFKHLSTMDLMLMQRRRVANVPVEPNTPPKQK